MTEEKSTRRVPRQARSRERYDLILDTAARLFAEAGYEGTTTNAIAEEAGVSVGSLYQYFESKEAVLHALAARYLENMQQLQQETFSADVSDLSIEEMVDRQIDPFIAFFEKHPGFGHIFLGSDISADLATAAAQLDREVIEGIKLFLQQRNPRLPEERAFLAATVVKGMVKGLFGLLETTRDPAFQADIAAEIKHNIADYARRVVEADN